MTSVLDLVLEEEKAGMPVKCSVCKWIMSRPESEQAEWDAIMEDPTRTNNAAIQRALVRSGLSLGKNSTVIDHRRKKHRVRDL